MSLSYQHKKYAVATKESNFLTRLHVEQETPVMESEEAPAQKESLQDVVFFWIFPAILVGLLANELVNRFFG